MNTKVIAEIGINHNGDLELAKRLILTAKAAGFDFVKFQKRNPDVCVPEAEKSIMRDTPWGRMTYLEYKWKVEFSKLQYLQLFEFCDTIGIGLFASVWDKDSVDFMADIHETTGTECIMKIPSALITDHELCRYARANADILLISTGMSTEQEIIDCVNISHPDVIFHTNSTYPSPYEELNLQYITHLKQEFPNKSIGYSGHEYGLTTTFAAVALGAEWIERHVTLDRNMWGSDQKASVEPSGMFKLITGIRDIEKAMALQPGERTLYPSELAKRKTLRGV
jgi:N-acetylneuraminate synthase